MRALGQFAATALFIAGVITAAAVINRTVDPAHGRQSLRADKIVVVKHQRVMHLMWKGRVVKTYRIALGFTPKGHKTEEGDGKTPEGVYTIDRRLPRSQFHRGLHISYPNDADKARAKRRGVSPGGAIVIHGLGDTMRWAGRTHTSWDWTAGCIAVTNREIEEIFAAVPPGTPIEIRP